MKKILSIIILAVTTTSCNDGIGTVTITTFVNNSGHNIEFQEFFLGEYQKSSFIKNNEHLELDMSIAEGDGNTPFSPPPFDADSIWVIYFEKASIMHTTDVTSPVSRSLMLESSYEGGKVKDGVYEFTYTFTPADFEEALEFGN